MLPSGSALPRHLQPDRRPGIPGSTFVPAATAATAAAPAGPSGRPEPWTKATYRRRLPHRWSLDAVESRASYRNVGTLMLREQHRGANVVPAGGRATATGGQRCCRPGDTGLLSGPPDAGSPDEAAAGTAALPTCPHRARAPAGSGPCSERGSGRRRAAVTRGAAAICGHTHIRRFRL